MADRRAARRGGAKSRRRAGDAPSAGPDGTPFDAPTVEWDDVVDIVCVGADTAGRTAAIACQKVGLSTYLVATAPALDESLPGRWGVADSDSMDYLEALTDDIAATGMAKVGTELPLRFVEGPVTGTPDSRSGVFDFIGASLRTWANACLDSPCGVVSTAVADPRFTTTYAGPGRSTEVLAVGTVELPPALSFEDWIAAEASAHGVRQEAATTLQRLVFDDGRVAGVALQNPTGECLVRARHGVILALETADRTCTWPTDGIGGLSTAEVAVVTRAASRFGRPELLVPSPRD